jgi:hypothetical protein
VSLTHQGVEYLQRKATENLIHFVIQKYGVKQSDLQDQYLQFARDDTSALNTHQQLRDIIGTRYARFNPDTARGAWGGVNLDQYRQDAYWIPQSLSNALDRLNRPKSNLAAMFDKATQTFRIAVVGLSPRTQLYNVLGGATMVTGQAGPGVWRYWTEAGQILKDPSMLDNETVRSAIGSMKRDFLDSDIGKAQATTSYLFGRSVRRMYDDAIGSGAITKTRTALGKVAEASFDLNGFFDDRYRVMAYLYGYDKALTRGMSEEAARLAGEQLLTKSMMDWMSMSPIERDVLKSIFPFYGFMRHAIGYVLRYPFDHPLRAAVLGAFGRAEQEDLGGLPLSHLAMVPVPFLDADKAGSKLMMSLGAVNPFGDVANMLTVAGFVGATNPVISTLLESVGVDSTGSAELYPTMRFDPDTGRLNAVHPNLLMSFAQNTIPQSAVLFAAMGANQDFNDRVKSDPAGAMRSLLSAVGLPPIPRTVNPSAEFFKTELNRLRDVRAVKNDALRTGDWSTAANYSPSPRSWRSSRPRPRPRSPRMRRRHPSRCSN